MFELALELGDGLLLGSPAADERIERRQRQGHVGGDGAVLEVRVVRAQWRLSIPALSSSDANDSGPPSILIPSLCGERSG